MLMAWMAPMEAKLHSHPSWYQHLPIQQQEEKEELFYGIENRKHWGIFVPYGIGTAGALSVISFSPNTKIYVYGSTVT